MYTPSKELCEPFVLTEQNVRRIIEIIENRRPKNADDDYTPTYKYRRLDDYERETKDINDLFNEDNRGDTRIVGLIIESSDYFFPNKGLNYKIEFNSCENIEEFEHGFMFFKSISYGVKGENRDLSELLFNELDHYINNNVIWHKQKRLVNFLKKFTMISFSYLMLMLGLAVSISSVFSAPNNSNKQHLIENALASEDIIEKINTLLLLQQNNSDLSSKPSVLKHISSILAVILLILYVIINFNKKLRLKLCYYYPFIFNFGLSPESYESRCAIIKTFLGILGTLVLGLVGNLLYSIISNWLFPG